MIRTLVVGIGNILQRDDGAGVCAARCLERMKLPAHVRVAALESRLSELLPLAEWAERLIVLDAVAGGGEPGKVFALRPKDLADPAEAVYSLHQLGLQQTLSCLERLGGAPVTTIIGVEPGETGTGIGLSPAVRKALPKVVDLVLKEIRAAGDHSKRGGWRCL